MDSEVGNGETRSVRADGESEQGRQPRPGRRLRTSTVPATAPDLAVIARDAVINFLHDASAATAERAAGQEGQPEAAGTTNGMAAVTDGPPGVMPGGGAATAQVPAPAPAADVTAEATVWQAAATSVAALDRIEAAAAKIDADIAAALRAQGELYTRAGAAAEAAVRAAQSAAQASWQAGRYERRTRVALRQVQRYVIIALIVLIIAIILLVLTATPALLQAPAVPGRESARHRGSGAGWLSCRGMDTISRVSSGPGGEGGPHE